MEDEQNHQDRVHAPHQLTRHAEQKIGRDEVFNEEDTTY